MRKAWKVTIGLGVLALVATACPSDKTDVTKVSSLLDTVKDRGRVVCGVNNAVPGFGFVDSAGAFSGFDIDFCKAVAAALFGDATKVEFKPLTADQRFTALQSREVDVLIRNTTWTAKRDGAEGAAFATTTFYDGQGMMVTAGSKYKTLADMRNTTICVLSGTTTEQNLEAQFKAQNIPYTPLSFKDNDTLQQAFTGGRCQGWTSDKSQLAGVRSGYPAAQGGPEGLRILEVTMSKEPLGPVVRDGDSKWFDVVNWATLATIQAEEFGLTAANVDQAVSSSTDPEVQRFLGVVPAGAEAFDAGLGLPANFAVNVIKAVGNYGEIYERNVGPNTALGLPRGLNSLWTEGGLLYPIPYR
jgi:general L-amino acid transport system substrate-binding protein